MSNTPCAYAVSSVLHRRVEIKTQNSHPEQQNHRRWFVEFWWPGAESNRAEDDRLYI